MNHRHHEVSQREFETPLADIMEVLADPAIQYTTKVSGIEAFVNFMSKTGTLRNPPASWRDMFFPEALAQTGG
jgi:NitT/TauT family transport system substrate-binding protein